MTETEIRRGDVVLVAFPFIAQTEVGRKRRPALVIQADRYNRRRSAVIIAAISSAISGRTLRCKVPIAKDSRAGRRAGLRLDSVVDCQTLATVPREELVGRLGALPPEAMGQVDRALEDALGLG